MRKTKLSPASLKRAKRRVENALLDAYGASQTEAGEPRISPAPFAADKKDIINKAVVMGSVGKVTGKPL